MLLRINHLCFESISQGMNKIVLIQGIQLGRCFQFDKKILHSSCYQHIFESSITRLYQCKSIEHLFPMSILHILLVKIWIFDNAKNLVLPKFIKSVSPEYIATTQMKIIIKSIFQSHYSKNRIRIKKIQNKK